MEADHPFESLAKAYSLVILNNNLNHRLELMEQLIKEYGVDGLVIHSARSCKPYSIGQYDLRSLLMERLGVPSVIIEADITDSRVYSEEQTRTRVEAFFEDSPEFVKELAVFFRFHFFQCFKYFFHQIFPNVSNQGILL